METFRDYTNYMHTALKHDKGDLPNVHLFQSKKIPKRELTAAILLPKLQHSSPILVTVVSRKMLVQEKGGKRSHFSNPKFLTL